MELQDTALDFNKICRLCLSVETVMSSIYNEADNISNSAPLPLKIMACVSVEISSTDGLPSQICASCLCQVDGWYKFKDLCENADSILRKYVKNEPVQVEAVSHIQSMAQEIKKRLTVTQNVKKERNGPSQNQADSLLSKKRLISRLETTKRRKKKNDITAKVSGVPLSANTWVDDEITSAVRDDGDRAEEQSRTETEAFIQDEDDGSKKKRRKLNYYDVVYDHPVPTKDGKVHQCRICRKYLKNVTTRNRHEIEKHPPPLPCEFCQKTFTTVLTYHTHRNIHLGLTKFRCKYCGKYLASRSNLEDHEKVHTKERPVQCPQCDKTFSSMSNLRVHLKFHAGVKTYFCHVCGKGHVTIGNLKLHVKRHSNERSHVCHICGKGFNGKSELNKHIESHNSEKKYSCQYCLQKLKTPNSLRRHINIQHLKLRPYKCDVCLRDFGRRENLKEHMQVHTVKKEFYCEVCSRQFTHVRYLKKHKCGQ